jgi:hypothetical protein
MYNLPPDYQHRTEPAYFDDVLQDSSEWQKDVYRLAAHLARGAGIDRLVDIGCGRGEKLLTYADEFEIIGLDYGDNIAYCQEHNNPGTWVNVDLNRLIVPADMFYRSVVICADIIEHLPNPEIMIDTLKNACQLAKYVLLSTPDRQRVYHGQHSGPPGNPYHCREWTNAELVMWLRSEGLPVQWFGWTISNQHRPDQVWTSLVVLSKTELILNLTNEYEPAPVLWDSLAWKHD